MSIFTKPRKLCEGDRIATISLSGGAAGEEDMHWRYVIAKNRLEKEFGLEVVETPNSQKGRDFIYRNPRARADDLMGALEDPEIKGIFLNQGGDDGIRISPYVDYRVITQNPKIFMGYSDGSTFCCMYMKAGVVSFYGPNVITTLSEPVRLHDYTAKWIKKVLFSDAEIGRIEPAPYVTSEPRDWSGTDEKPREMIPSDGYEVLQGAGKVSGPMIGGCMGPMNMMLGPGLFPSSELFWGSIICLEGAIGYGIKKTGEHGLRALASTGMFREANGVVFSRPGMMYEENKEVILKIIRDEEGRTDMPILMGLNCSHVAPMTIVPFGIEAEIDCDNRAFTILESAVV